MKRFVIAIAILLIFAQGFILGAYITIRTAEYWSDGEGVYEIGYFGGLTIHEYYWEESK